MLCGSVICFWFWLRSRSVFFFFQAEDGIRDKLVTGVQTCALPIFVITPIRDAQRVLVGFAKVTRDATERRRAEAEIRRQKGFTEQLINSSTDGILAFDRDCRYTLWSEGMARISGVKAEEVMGRPALEVFPFFKDTGEDKHYVAALEGRKVTEIGRAHV